LNVFSNFSNIIELKLSLGGLGYLLFQDKYALSLFGGQF